LTGQVMGGLAPISGTTITVYAAGTSGYGAGATVLGSATSGSDGSFAINYTQSAKPPLYAIASGGNAGGGTNSAIRLLAVLKTSSSSPNAPLPPSIVINELTTIGSVWPMTQFFDRNNATEIGTSSTNLTGLEDAAAAVGLLVDVATGKTTLPSCSAPTAPVPPNCLTEEKLNTFANLVAACVVTSGPSNAFPGDCPTISPTSPACDQVLCPSHSNDLLTATLLAALNPGIGISSIPIDLVNSSSPYQPIVTSLNDLTLMLNFTDSSFNEPIGLAIDGNSNVWVANNGDTTVTELGPLGTPVSGSPFSTGGQNPWVLAIDGLNNVWVVNNGTSTVAKLTSSGAQAPGSPFSGNGLSGPKGVAIDRSNNAWISNNDTNTVTVLSNGGAPVSGSPFATTGSFPTGIAFDTSGNAWIANQQGNSLTELDPLGAFLNTFTAAFNDPTGIQIDQDNNVWITNLNGGKLTKLLLNGTQAPGSPFTTPSLSAPVAVAIDGASNIWVSGYVGTSSVDEFNPSGTLLSPATGFQGGGLALSRDFGIAIDRAGDVWISNNGNNTVTEILGAAVPVTTPLIGPPAKP
jgi:streptogramin lyase